MRKRIVALLIVLMFVFSSVVFADINTTATHWKTVIVDNTTGEYINYSVPTTTIFPDRSMILGVCVVPLADATSNSEALVALYDSTGVNPTGIVSDEVFDEAEADGTSTFPNWYPYPRKILTQLTLRVGANTRAIVYYE